MTGLDRAKLAAARLWAAHRYPYLASALFASPVLEAADGAGVTVDERWRIHADPAVVDAWDVSRLGAQLVHHTGHLLRDHAARARAAAVPADRRQHWVDAVDAEINDDLPAELLVPDGAVLPESFGAERGRFAEEYYRLERSGPPSGHDCGSGAHGHASAEDRRRPAHGGDGSPGVAPAEAEVLRRRVAAETVAHQQGHGDVPAGLLRWADGLVGGRVDWRAELAAELRWGIAAVAGAVDYTYARPSRRSCVTGGVVLPALRRPEAEVAVVCDTSASVSGDLLGAALAEVDGISAAVGRRGVRVLACDAAVHEVHRITSATGLAVSGGGGTDMGEGIAAAAGLRPRPQVVVVLTDGYSPWPDDPPAGMRVVVGLIGPTRAQAPPWAREVRIEELAPPPGGARH